MLALGARLSLWSRSRHLIHEILLRSGANPEMGLALYPIFQEVGLPAPKMHLEMPLGAMPISYGSLQACFTVCDRYPSNTESLWKTWATWTRFPTESVPKLLQLIR